MVWENPAQELAGEGLSRPQPSQETRPGGCRCLPSPESRGTVALGPRGGMGGNGLLLTLKPACAPALCL